MLCNLSVKSFQTIFHIKKSIHIFRCGERPYLSGRQNRPHQLKSCREFHLRSCLQKRSNFAVTCFRVELENFPTPVAPIYIKGVNNMKKRSEGFWKFLKIVPFPWVFFRAPGICPTALRIFFYLKIIFIGGLRQITTYKGHLFQKMLRFIRKLYSISCIFNWTVCTCSNWFSI